MGEGGEPISSGSRAQPTPPESPTMSCLEDGAEKGWHFQPSGPVPVRGLQASQETSAQRETWEIAVAAWHWLRGHGRARGSLSGQGPRHLGPAELLRGYLILAT